MLRTPAELGGFWREEAKAQGEAQAQQGGKACINKGKCCQVSYLPRAENQKLSQKRC
jgi:hypothetical protein